MTEKEKEKLAKKLAKINKKLVYGLSCDFRDHEHINRTISYFLRLPKLVILENEREHITRERRHITFDGEERRDLALKN